MPPFQAIGTAMGLHIGQDISPKILPFINSAKSRIAALEAQLAKHEGCSRWGATDSSILWEDTKG
jgi:hypothetical protein